MFFHSSQVKAKPRTVLITGSTRGIGLATAIKFLQNGDNVAIFCRHETHVSAAVKELSSNGDKKHLASFKGDVRSATDLSNILSATLDRFGHLDILVNNAGVGLYKSIEDTSEAEWDEVLGINLKGQFLATKLVLPRLRKQGGGMIINISSGLGVHTEAHYSAYSASKFGIMALTEVTADETKSDHIKVYAVLPGGVATKLHLDMHPQENPATMMQPEYIGEKILELAQGNHPSGYQLSIYS